MSAPAMTPEERRLWDEAAVRAYAASIDPRLRYDALAAAEAARDAYRHATALLEQRRHLLGMQGQGR